MKSTHVSEPVRSTTQVWLASIPALGSVAIFALWRVLPHSAVSFGPSGFDVFNVWVILTGPVAALAVWSLRRCPLSAAGKVLLGILNTVAVVLSLCLLLLAAGL